jgi:hypothetical protein
VPACLYLLWLRAGQKRGLLDFPSLGNYVAVGPGQRVHILRLKPYYARAYMQAHCE